MEYFQLNTEIQKLKNIANMIQRMQNNINARIKKTESFITQNRENAKEL